MATKEVRIRDRTIVEVLFKLKYDLPSMQKTIPEMYGKQGPSRNTIKKVYDELMNGTFHLCDPVHEGKKLDPVLIQNVEKVVSDEPHAGLREIARRVKSNKDSVNRCLIGPLKRKKKHLKWVPHTLNATQKKERVKIATDMLKILKEDEENDFANIITGDESWFWYRYDHEAVWATAGEAAPERPKQGLGCEKVMIWTFWGVNVTPVFVDLPKGETMTAKVFEKLVLDKLIPVEVEKGTSQTDLILHFDNAACHKARLISDRIERAKLRVMPQPPYSPDLAPSDFFLFGYLKRRLRGKCCKTAEDLVREAKKIMDNIPKTTRLRVFRTWMWRLETVIANEVDYY
jgi:transposase